MVPIEIVEERRAQRQALRWSPGANILRVPLLAAAGIAGLSALGTTAFHVAGRADATMTPGALAASWVLALAAVVGFVLYERGLQKGRRALSAYLAGFANEVGGEVLEGIAGFHGWLDRHWPLRLDRTASPWAGDEWMVCVAFPVGAATALLQVQTASTRFVRPFVACFIAGGHVSVLEGVRAVAARAHAQVVIHPPAGARLLFAEHVVDSVRRHDPATRSALVDLAKALRTIK